MLVISRVLAQMIDIFLGFFILVVSFLYVYPLFYSFFPSVYTSGILIMIFVVVAYFLIQYPFYTHAQTVGKAFFALYVKPLQENIKIGFSYMFVREVLLKVSFLYVGCLPVFVGQKSIHERNTNTIVVIKRKVHNR